MQAAASSSLVPDAPVAVPADGVLVSRADGLQILRRGERLLVVEPESASWYVLDSTSWPVFARTVRPLPFGALRAALPEHDPEALTRLVGQLHYLGLLRLNGRPYHDLDGLWEGEVRTPQFLALHMAHGCNFRCSYCYNSSEMFRGRTMPIPTAKRILEKAFTELPSDVLSFDFMGGEPLLAFDEVVEVLRYGRELEQRHGKSASFLMQTNGALLTPERIRVLREHRVGVGVSIDGPEDLHDLYRVSSTGAGTHSQVLPNLLRARDMGLKVAPLAVIYDPDCYVRVLDYFVEDLGFDTMRFNYSNYMGRAKENLSFHPARTEEFHRGFMAMVDRALHHARRLGRPLTINDLCFMIRNVTTKRRDYMCMRSPCGLGDSILSFSVDGNVYACEEYEENTKGKFLLGRLEELDLGNLMALSEKLRGLKQRRVENIPRCSRCYLRNVCGGGCTHKALAYYGELLREDPMCRFYELTYTELMWKIWDEPDLVPLLGGQAYAPAQ